MIRPLRRRHLWMVVAVAVIAGPLYLAALAARPEPPVEETAQESLPAALTGPAPAVARGAEAELPTDPPTQVRSAEGGRAVVLEAAGYVEGADLLLYWAPGDGSGAPADAWLLGAFRGRERQAFILPEAAAGQAGTLLLYSLGHGETVAHVAWPANRGLAP